MFLPGTPGSSPALLLFLSFLVLFGEEEEREGGRTEPGWSPAFPAESIRFTQRLLGLQTGG